MFDFNPLYLSDGYKIGHYKMLAPGTTRLYGTDIPRKIKYMPTGIDKIVSFGNQLKWRWLDSVWKKNFFDKSWEELSTFVSDMTVYLNLPYDGDHFKRLHDLGYLPIRAKALPEGIETPANVPHSTFVNTVDGFAWLTLYLETILSAASWKASTSATLALQYRRNVTKWVMETDPDQAYLIPYMCHDFSARGLSPWDMMSSGLGHATSFRGSDSLVVIPAARTFYDETDVCINSVNASEHSVSCTQLFYYERELRSGNLNDKIKEFYSFDLPSDGSIDNPDYLTIAEWIMLDDWLDRFPKGLLSIVDDTMDTWKHITQIIARLKDKIINRDGKLVTRPDSGNPVDIICGKITDSDHIGVMINGKVISPQEQKGVIELLWDIFGGTVNEQGYKVLDPHIGCIYGDAINLDRQVEIYERLKDKRFAATCIVLGVGSFTYQFNSRDSLGWAVKGSWFEVEENVPEEERFLKIGEWKRKVSYNIYKDPATDSGTKKSLKGLIRVNEDFSVKQECTWEEEGGGLLQTIYEDGKFYNSTTLAQVRERINQLV